MSRSQLSLLFLLLALPLVVGCGNSRPDDDDDDTVDDSNEEDLDADGFCPGTECSDESLEPGDCDDNDSDSYPGASEACDGNDNNCDGRIDEDFDRDQDGYIDEYGLGCISHYGEEDLDCNDLIAAINPGAEESCDGNDNNCNGLIDDGLDVDGDGYRICDSPSDCDDNDASVYPNAAELCDGIDNNCNNITDDGIGMEFVDADGDGWTPCMGDCNDVLPDGADINPGEDEACDELDNDCDGDVDEDLDMDGDGIPGPAPGCLAAFGGVDCDDTDPTLYPGAPEFCDNADNDCDGLVDEDLDFDGDGYTSCQGDCDSLNAAVNPGVNEVCDALDNDCDGIVDNGYDLDGDGVSVCAGDCDDAAITVYTGAPELCDGIDNDCDGAVGSNENDLDGDTYSSCDGDCDETNVSRYPGAEELCNSLDDDCDGVVPTDELDNDLDGFVGCTPDGCSLGIALDTNGSSADLEQALSPLGLDYIISSPMPGFGMTDLSAFSENQVLVWQTSARDIDSAESVALLAFADAGKTLLVTGPDSLSNSECYYSTLGDDDDSAAGDDDDSAAGDDDDSAAGDDDDSAADDCSEEIPVMGSELADLIGSTSTGDGPDATTSAVSNNTTGLTSGPFGSYNTATTFTNADSNHENATANTAAGAVRVAAVGARAKVIVRSRPSGGQIIFWNGDGVADWLGDSTASDLALNGIYSANLGCNAQLQGGDCDDNDATMVPGSCN